MRRICLIGTATLACLLTIALVGAAARGRPSARHVIRDDDGGSSALFLGLLPVAQQGASYVGTSRCGSCHGTGLNGAPRIDMAAYASTEMGGEGVGCEHCHGPGSSHTAAPSRLNILTYPNIARHEVCTQCHEDQAQQYAQSKHSTAVAEVIATSTANPAQGKTCLRCHSSPLRLAKIDVAMDKGLTPDAIDTAITSMANADVVAYAGATIESPACANCHNPHRRTAFRTWTGDQKQLRRSVYNTDVSVVGQPSTPNKLIVTYNQLCASCHMGGAGSTANASDPALESGTARPNMHEQPQFYMLMGLGGVEGSGLTRRNMAHATAPGQCTHCHMPDHRHTMTVDAEKSCEPCHSKEDATRRATRRRSSTTSALLALKTRMEKWAQATLADPDMWDYTSLIQAKGKTPPAQTLVPIQVKRARHNYYLVLRDGSLGVHNYVYATRLLTVANQNLDALGVPTAVLTVQSQTQGDLVIDAERRRGWAAELSKLK